MDKEIKKLHLKPDELLLIYLDIPSSMAPNKANDYMGETQKTIKNILEQFFITSSLFVFWIYF